MVVLSIGSVIKISNYKMCIIGYTTAQNNKKETCGYLVVPYPVGFYDSKKIFFVPFDAKFTVIAEGYKTETTETVVDVVTNNMRFAEKISYDDLLNIQKIYKESFSKNEEAKK